MTTGKGILYPSEYRQLRDDQTGAIIHQLTSHPSINHHLYFLNRSFTPDGKTVVFTSHRNGQPQLCELSFPRGPIRQLTDEEGLHPFSACLSQSGQEIFFTRNGSLYSLQRENLEEVCLASFTGGQLGECNLSRSGQWIVTAIKRSGHSGIALASTNGREYGVVFQWPRTLIHPQFHPHDENLIEFSSDPAPRMHLFHRDTGRVECLYEHGNAEFVAHETFLGNTGDLLFTVWPLALKRFHLATRQVSTVANFNAWHIAPDALGDRVVCDSNHPDIGIQIVQVATGQRRTLCFPKSSNQGSQWKTSRYALEEDWAHATAHQAQERETSLSWMEMKTDTVYGPQWTHPHPSWSPDESRIVYTSDVSGFPQVYVVEIPEGYE